MNSTPQSTPEEAITALAALPDLGEVGLSFTAVGTSSSGVIEGYEIKLTEAAQLAISNIAQATREQIQDASLIAYGPTVLVPRQHWMHVGQSDAGTLAAIEESVEQHDLLPFNAKSDEASRVKMLAARFTTKDHSTVTFFRIADSILQFKKSKFLGLLQEGDVYDRLDPGDVLLLRTDFDVVVINEWAFFFKKSTFERAFGFLDKLKEESLNTFNSVTGRLRIEGYDQLRKACTSQIQMMAKMSSIKRSIDTDPEYAKAMTMARLVKYIEEHPHVDIDIVGSGKNRRLVFDPKPARRFQILKLLDDDFLHSVLTERDYEAPSKLQTGPA